MESRCIFLVFVAISTVLVDCRVFERNSGPDLCERRCMTSTIHECSPADHMMSYEGASQSCLRCLDQCNGKGLDDDLGALWR
ncbi:hypothetical protein PRIPAC_79930 [Pristionchus pacificus]|uniref:Uncharacterized protein n=1 Tax=Pristionchus pacificus TaxID=54126 RepID=A0A2A6CKY9_PRIPA|nr:hypothetical protein PRIPAC_79930 [Pristionchus pacificus]|eukprot:PDM78776.1 hypothetical protein PRIPAC_31355 [Pristionchus pacificus]